MVQSTLPRSPAQTLTAQHGKPTACMVFPIVALKVCPISTVGAEENKLLGQSFQWHNTPPKNVLNFQVTSSWWTADRTGQQAGNLPASS
jgi:hypothetical protein